MKKEIVFNALQTSMSGGIGRYSYELGKELYNLKQGNIKLVIREEDFEDFSFVKREDLIIVKDINNSLQRNFYEQIILPYKIYKKYPMAKIHYPDSMAPLLARNKVIITVHDLAFKTLKGVFKKRTIIWKRIATLLSLKKADKVIAITNFTRSEIENNYPKMKKEKLNLVYNGFNNFSAEEIRSSELSTIIQNIQSKYILTVSTISPRKNIDTLIKAYAKIHNQVNYKLIIAGGDGWLSDEIYKLVENLKLTNKVIFTGKITDNELKYLYKNTECFIYPSKYEGFGLPPLEALSYKKEIILSNIPVFNEVYGDVAKYFELDEIDTLANLLNSEFKEKGEINKFLSKYNWEVCAKDTYKIY